MESEEGKSHDCEKLIIAAKFKPHIILGVMVCVCVGGGMIGVDPPSENP